MGLLRTYVHRQVPVSQHEPEEDPDQNTIDPAYKVKKGVIYPTFNPDVPWNQMKPILGMRYEDSQQLKFALANYGVANGYQLWHMKNDWRSVLVYCGRNVDEGRCAAKKGEKNRLMANEKKALLKKGEKVVTNDYGEGTSKRKKRKVKKKPVKKKSSGYMHLGKESDLGVSDWYSQDKWFSAYQFSINPVWGSKTWKRTNDKPPLPPLVRKMPGRPQKARIKAPNENNGFQVTRVGRTMTCSNCWQKGHNKAGCKNPTQPKPQTEKRQPGRKRETGHGQCASRGGRGGKGSRGGRGGRGSRGGRGEDAFNMWNVTSYDDISLQQRQQMEHDEEIFMEEEARKEQQDGGLTEAHVNLT
ncbi:hypothetical protein CTI12_AA374350 [Artemisia annua]|uniref:Uncharacterized protein n=1 Tax=Artemisia annua TaxID=35608 RepID=A0A2U1MJ38_ARTAN|nr:hypothetical protein CTI12_AA374350 [Artemisia annua]